MFLFVRCCFTIKKNTLAFPTSFRAIRFVQTNRCPREVIEFKILRKQPLQGRCEREKTENANLSLKLERRQRRREVPVTIRPTGVPYTRGEQFNLAQGPV